MKVGDLVVRWWCDKPLWRMIGIVTEVYYQNDERENKFAIYWSSERRRGQLQRWSWNEVRKIDEIR